MRVRNLRLAGLELEPRQPRLATEAGVESDTESRKRTEDGAADRGMAGDSSSARANDGPTSLTSFGMIAKPPSPETSVGDALIYRGAEAPKPCLSPLEMRTPTAASDLLPAGIAFT